MADMYEVILSDDTRDDFEKAREWYDSQQANLGFDFALKFEEVIELLEDNPLRYHRAFDDTRKIALKRFPYSAFFKVYENTKEVVIIALLFNKRNPDILKERL